MLHVSPDTLGGDEHDHDHPEAGDEGADDWSGVSVNETAADADNLPYTYRFVKRKEHYLPIRFAASDFENKRINIYKCDPARYRDTFAFKVHDPVFAPFVFPCRGRVTSRFGPRNLYGSRFHYGLDVGLRTGDTIRAAMPGIVRIVRYDPRGYGKFVVITHEGGLETLYGHMSKTLIEEGTEIQSGEPIGLGGSTGRSSGPHLHFEFRFLGRPFDPEMAFNYNKREVHDNTLVVQSDWFHYNPNTACYRYASSKKKRANLVSNDSGDSRYYIVRSGDTLSRIAEEYGTSVNQICRLNGMSESDALHPGNKLRVM